MTEHGCVWEEATSEAAREEVYRFRYTHYFSSREHLPGVEHEQKRVFSPHDAKSTHFLARDAAGRLLAVGTATPAEEPTLLDLWKDIFALPRLRGIDLATVVLISRVVVLPEARHSGLFGQFFLWMAEQCLRRGFVHAAHYCAPGLVPLYERLGYRVYGRPGNLPHGGPLRLPMLLVTSDHEHLRRVRSVFRALPAFSAEHPEITRKVLDALPELRHVPLCGMRDSGRLRVVREFVPEIPDSAGPVLRHASILTLVKNTVLAQPEYPEGLFFVLKGRLAAEPGGLFGPGTFVDTTSPAKVRAETDVTVLTFYLARPQNVCRW